MHTGPYKKKKEKKISFQYWMLHRNSHVHKLDLNELVINCAKIERKKKRTTISVSCP